LSHFTTVVITSTPEEVERVLAPYDEGLEVPHIEYVEPADLEQALEHYTEHPEFGVNVSDPVAVLRAWYGDEVMTEDGPDGTVLFGRQSTRNPNSKWDWWQIGGRWGGFFQLKAGESAKPADVGEYEFEHSLNGFEVPDLHGKTDQARKRQIDFEAMRGEATVKAHGDYDRFEMATRGLEVPRLWRAVLDLYGEDQVNLARKVYHEQPFIKALQSARLGPYSDDPVEHWCVTSGGRAAYVQHKADAAGVPFAMVADGVWRERGRMGWFAMVADEQEPQVSNAAVRRIYDQLPDDALLTCIDCHI